MKDIVTTVVHCLLQIVEMMLLDPAPLLLECNFNAIHTDPIRCWSISGWTLVEWSTDCQYSFWVMAGMCGHIRHWASLVSMHQRHVPLAIFSVVGGSLPGFILSSSSWWAPMSWILAHKTLFILALTDGYAIIVRQNGTVFWHDVIGFVDVNWISVPTGLNFAPIVFKLHDQVPNTHRQFG